MENNKFYHKELCYQKRAAMLPKAGKDFAIPENDQTIINEMRLEGIFH